MLKITQINDEEIDMTKIKKLPSKKQSIKKTDEIPNYFQDTLNKLNFQPFCFEVNKSGKCFYCDEKLADCGCVLLELGPHLEELSADFKKIHVRDKENTYIVLNLKMWPKNDVRVLAYNIKENRLLYKSYDSDGRIFWPPNRSFGCISEGRWDEDVEIIGVELDDNLYTGLSLTGRTQSNVEYSNSWARRQELIPPPKTTRRTLDLISLQKKSKKKVSNAA